MRNPACAGAAGKRAAVKDDELFVFCPSLGMNYMFLLGHSRILLVHLWRFSYRKILVMKPCSGPRCSLSEYTLSRISISACRAPTQSIIIP